MPFYINHRFIVIFIFNNYNTLKEIQFKYRELYWLFNITPYYNSSKLKKLFSKKLCTINCKAQNLGIRIYNFEGETDKIMWQFLPQVSHIIVYGI